MHVIGNISYDDHTYGVLHPRGGANKVTVGKYTSLGENTIVNGGFDHNYRFISTYPFHTMVPGLKSNIPEVRDIHIGNDVWVGSSCLIMDGAVLSDGAVLGAKSFVKKNTYIGPYQLWAGSPAKFIKSRFDYLNLNKGDRRHSNEVERKLLKLCWWNLPHEEVLSIAHLLISEDFDKLFEKYNIT